MKPKRTKNNIQTAAVPKTGNDNIVLINHKIDAIFPIHVATTLIKGEIVKGSAATMATIAMTGPGIEIGIPVDHAH